MKLDIATLILRVSVGGMLLLHGIHKIIHGVAFVKGMLQSAGLPELLVYGVYAGEILAPIFLIIGWKSRFWASVVAVNMLAAIYLAHRSDLFTVGAHGGWAVELPMFYLAGAAVIALLGSGRYAIQKD